MSGPADFSGTGQISNVFLGPRDSPPINDIEGEKDGASLILLFSLEISHCQRADERNSFSDDSYGRCMGTFRHPEKEIFSTQGVCPC